MDYLLQEFMRQERWEKAIDDAVDKGISKTELRQLCMAETRALICQLIDEHKYKIAPPREQKIPKDNKGEFRTVYINENADRVFLSIANDMLMELCKDMIHPSCKSYQKGIGCSHVVMQISNIMVNNPSEVMGFKADLSKYFDSVPIEYIDLVFDTVEERFGKSALIDVIRDYYHQDIYIDEHGNVAQKYQSLKQGCSVASFLADVLLYDMDECMSQLDGFYVRYSDDILYLGNEIGSAETFLKLSLKMKGLKLNPKKFEYLKHDMWFKFLGFNIKAPLHGDVMRTLSKGRVKTFQKEIEKRTIHAKNTRMTRAVNQVNNYLYKGEYPWATSVLPVMNVQHDIDTLNQFVMDCIRACGTQKKKVGGLGVDMNKAEYTILRGVGKNVKANRLKTEKEILGYKSLDCMRNLLLITRPVYDTIVRQM